MNLDGVAGRALGRRIGVGRERNDRLASNDNGQPVEVAPGGVAQGERSGCDRGETGARIASRQRGEKARDTRQHVGGLD